MEEKERERKRKEDEWEAGREERKFGTREMWEVMMQAMDEFKDPRAAAYRRVGFYF